MSQIYKKGIKLRVIVFTIFTSWSFVGLLFIPMLLLKMLQDCSVNSAMVIFSCGILHNFVFSVLFIANIYAWLVYFYMGYGWIFRKIVSNKWLFSGTISALIPLSWCIYLSFHLPLKFILEVFLTSVGSAIPFACYLVTYHLKGNTK